MSLAPFQEMPWVDVAPFAREKRVDCQTHTLRLVEFQRGFVEHDWCEKSHYGYVVDGRFTVQFDHSLVEYAKGDGIYISPGFESRHKAIVEDEVVVFLVEPRTEIRD